VSCLNYADTIVDMKHLLVICFMSHLKGGAQKRVCFDVVVIDACTSMLAVRKQSELILTVAMTRTVYCTCPETFRMLISTIKSSVKCNVSMSDVYQRPLSRLLSD